MTDQQTPAPRVALVTGAAQGIGEAIALQLAADGLDVAINDIPSKEAQLAEVAKAIEGKGRRALVVCGDVSSEDDVSAMVSTTVAKLGGLDVVSRSESVRTEGAAELPRHAQMVANAGILLFKPITESTVEEYERMLSINTRGVFLCIKHAANHMVAQGRGGRIICQLPLCYQR